MRTAYLYIPAWNGSKPMSKPNRKEVESWRRTKINWCNPIGNLQACRHVGLFHEMAWMVPIVWLVLWHTVCMCVVCWWCICFVVRALLLLLSLSNEILIMWNEGGWTKICHRITTTNNFNENHFFFARLFLISSIEKRLQNGTKPKHNEKKKN